MIYLTEHIETEFAGERIVAYSLTEAEMLCSIYHPGYVVIGVLVKEYMVTDDVQNN